MDRTATGKRTVKVKLTLTKRTVENLQPADKPWIAWDDRLSGVGVRVQPLRHEGVPHQLQAPEAVSLDGQFGLSPWSR